MTLKKQDPLCQPGVEKDLSTTSTNALSLTVTVSLIVRVNGCVPCAFLNFLVFFTLQWYVAKRIGKTKFV